MKIEELYRLFLESPSVSTDTRQIEPGSIFFALKGDSFDGNHFAEAALRQGASYVVVDNPEVVKNSRYILSEDSLKTLQELAAFHRETLGIPILAITGTNGKTTTKELVAAVLSKKFKTCFTTGNLNNHIGVPLTILKMDKTTEFGVVEMGANHPGEIRELCKIANPDFGLITNIGKAHLEGFGSFEGVVAAKSELYQYLMPKGGKIFINSDNQILAVLAGDYPDLIKYGTTGQPFLKGETIDSPLYLNARAWFPKGVLYLQSKLIGQYNLENVLAAACTGKYFDVDPLLIQQAIAGYTPGNNRSQLIEKGSNKIIMDAYNANPTSMKASISNFFSFKGSPKVLILGDMLELGENSPLEHQQILEFLQGNNFDRLFLVGKNFSSAACPEGSFVFPDSQALISYLGKNPLSGSLILIKGSRGIHLEKVLDALN